MRGIVADDARNTANAGSDKDEAGLDRLHLKCAQAQLVREGHIRITGVRETGKKIYSGWTTAN